MSTVCESKFWVTLVGHSWEKNYFNGNIMTVGLYLVEIFYLSLKKYGCRIVLSWTDKNVCVFLTPTKSMFEIKFD